MRDCRCRYRKWYSYALAIRWESIFFCAAELFSSPTIVNNNISRNISKEPENLYLYAGVMVSECKRLPKKVIAGNNLMHMKNFRLHFFIFYVCFSLFLFTSYFVGYLSILHIPNGIEMTEQKYLSELYEKKMKKNRKENFLTNRKIIIFSQKVENEGKKCRRQCVCMCFGHGIWQMIGLPLNRVLNELIIRQTIRHNNKNETSSK